MTAYTDVTNAKRAAWGGAAIYLFSQLTGCDRQDALGDLLCDLMHWSGQNDFDFDLALNRAEDQFEEECDDEEMAAAIAAAPELLNALHYVRSVLKLRHRDEATDDQVAEALRMAERALALTKGGAQ